MLAEKTFLHLVAINFHEKGLSDRLAENRLGLKALDRLSNAQPQQVRKQPYNKKGHRSTLGGSLVAFEMFGHREKERKDTHEVLGDLNDSLPEAEKDSGEVHELELEQHHHDHHHRHHHHSKNKDNTKESPVDRKRRKRKAVTSVIVDQVGEAIGHVALKNHGFKREHGAGDLISARKLARRLFSALSDVSPPRSHLVVEGT